LYLYILLCDNGCLNDELSGLQLDMLKIVPTAA
jgi:hypothetical protein